MRKQGTCKRIFKTLKKERLKQKNLPSKNKDKNCCKNTSTKREANPNRIAKGYRFEKKMINESKMVNETKDDIFTQPTASKVKKDHQEQIAANARARNHGIDKSNTKSERNFSFCSKFCNNHEFRIKKQHSAVCCCFSHNGYIDKDR